MNKKFLSAILLGALTLASTGSFVSCKDYDDDIKNLQTQISTLALKSDVETKLGQLQSSLASAQSAAQTAQSTAEAAKKEAAEALAAAKAADNTAEVKKLEEQIKGLEAEIAAKDAELAKIKDAQDAVNAALEAVKKEVSDKMADFEKKTQDMIAEAQKKAEATVGKVADYVTSVEFLNRDNCTAAFLNGKVDADGKFGEKEVDPENGEHKATPVVEYKKDTYFSFTAGDALILRVNPANAVITKDMVKIVNGKGEELSIVEVADVKPYSEKVTKAVNTGLWQVVLKLAETKDADTKYEDAAKELYAVVVNNTISAAPTRNVLSDYQLTLGDKTAYAALESLDDVTLQSAETMDKAQKLAETKDRIGRTDKLAIPAKSGEKIKISFPKNCAAQYFYVSRDDKYATETKDENELNAWKSYSYTGLNEVCKVSDGTEISVTIPSNLKVGDEIAFRIFAVNYNGKLVKENGEQFVVYVGDAQKNTSVTGNITAVPGTTIAYTTGWLPIEGALVDRTGDKLQTTDIELKIDDKTSVKVSAKYSKDGETETAITDDYKKYSEIKFVQFSVADAASFKAWKDNATATRQIVTLSKNELKENVIDVKLTKVLPDAESTKKEMNYTWKAGQLVNGVYTAYLFPSASDSSTEDIVWTTTTVYAHKYMTQVINNIKDKDNVVIEVANAAVEADAKGKKHYTAALKASGAEKDLFITNKADEDETDLIDNKTQRDMTIGYNYGEISSELKAGDPYVVTVETVKVVFACPLDQAVQTYAWTKYEEKNAKGEVTVSKDVNVVTYETGWTAPATGAKLVDYLIAANTFDNSVFGGAFSKVNQFYLTDGVTAKLTSNETGNVDYFDVTFEGGDFNFKKKSGTTNPTADIPSTLEITLKDAFGHKNVYELPFTVKRAQ